MPNKDGTGPEGKGSQTGRQFGNCSGKGFGNKKKGKPLVRRGRI